MSDYFSKIWAEKYRPQTLDDLVLSDDNREFFTSITDTIPHMLFCSPPGQGKTTLAKIITKDILKCQYLYINASDENGVDDIRNKVITFAQTRSIDGKIKVVILDEADNLSSDAQKILRNVMEEYADHTRFILTANYRHRIIEPIESRCEIFDLAVDIRRFSVRVVNILNKENINITTNLSEFLKKRFPDFRRTLNDLQKYCISGQTKLPTEQSSTFAASILEQVLTESNIYDVRKYIIENEYTFNNDYQQLLKNLFEVCFAHSFRQESIKKLVLLHVTEAMYRDNFVVDHEINFYSCLLQINGLLSSK